MSMTNAIASRTANMSAAGHDPRTSRVPSRMHARVGQQVKPAKNLAEDCPRDHPIVGHVPGRQDVKDCGGADRAEHDEPAHPESECEQTGVPQGEHPLIIIIRY